MNKTFKELEKGDKIYAIELSSTRLVQKKGEPFMKPVIIRSVDIRSSSWGNGGVSVVLESGTVVSPSDPNSHAYVYQNSQDTSIYHCLNAYVYGTSKRACLEAAIDAVRKKNMEQIERRDRFNYHIDKNELTMAMLEDQLGSADFPDTILEFAEMALT
jgi:hypothetical protein